MPEKVTQSVDDGAWLANAPCIDRPADAAWQHKSLPTRLPLTPIIAITIQSARGGAVAQLGER
jgi:hypothetical protein